MAEDWRVRVFRPRPSPAEDDDPAWTAVTRDLPSRAGRDIKVSVTRRDVFLYAASAPAAARAKQAARDLLAEHELAADVRCDQWNRISKQWTSHESVMHAERRKSAATGQAAWLIRVGPAFRLRTLARRLEAEGLKVTRQGRYLFTGADCEDDAYARADQIRARGSASRRIQVQRSYDRPPPVRVLLARGGPIWVEPEGEWYTA